MNNEDKNLDKRLNNLQPVPFTSENQPSPEAKSKGWERRRTAQKMMNLYEKYQDMNYADFLGIKNDIKQNPQNYTVMEVDMFRYAKSPKFILDRIDRHISKAPTQTENTNTNLNIEDIRRAFNDDPDDKGDGYDEEQQPAK